MLSFIMSLSIEASLCMLNNVEFMTYSSKLYNLGQIQCPILHISDMPIRSNP